MAGEINIAAYSDALVVLGTAGVVVPLVRRWGINPILGYLGAGALLGPLGLGSFLKEAPALYWLTVVDAKNVSSIADLGIVFLLFLIGLELSFARLVTMRRLVVGLGVTQVAATSSALFAILVLLGVTPYAGAILATCMALSSTAIVVEILSSQGRLASGTGRAAFATLLAQDLAVVPILLLVSVLAGDAGGTVASSLVSALGQAFTALVVIVVLGRVLLRPLYRLVASSQSTELLLAVTLFVIVGTGVLAALAGVSMALGAFVAGLLLAETEYSKAIQTLVEPFKALLLGMFFFTVGMSIDVREIIREPQVLAAGIAGLIALKAAVLFALARAFRMTRTAALEVALMLGPAGEFAFVGIGAGAAAGVIDPKTASLGLTVASMSMALIPGLAALARHTARRIQPATPTDPELLVAPAPGAGHTIVVGYGRVGKVVAHLLADHQKAVVAVDSDAASVSRDRKAGHAVHFGDASSAQFLRTCGLDTASAVVITVHDATAIDEVVGMVRRLRPDVPIFSRARDAAHARHLYSIGVTDAVPETIEASLQLSETALVGIGVPIGHVIASIHGRRDAFREELQEAARRAGQAETRSIRPKSAV